MEKFDRLRVGGPICSICFFYPLSRREAIPHQNGPLPATTPCFSETCYRFWGLVDICVFFGKSATIFLLRKWPPAVVLNFPKKYLFWLGTASLSKSSDQHVSCSRNIISCSCNFFSAVFGGTDRGDLGEESIPIALPNKQVDQIQIQIIHQYNVSWFCLRCKHIFIVFIDL